MKNLTKDDLKRLWLLADTREEQCNEGSKTKKIYSELSDKVYNELQLKNK
jgi:hypothetical protein